MTALVTVSLVADRYLNANVSKLVSEIKVPSNVVSDAGSPPSCIPETFVKAANAVAYKEVREFLDWVYERAIDQGGTNPGRTSNKARDHLKAIISWAWEQDVIVSLPRFPKPKPQRDVAGRHYLTKTEINALYFATHQMKRPKGWQQPLSIGGYWRAALVVFFNYGLDTGTVWKSASVHEPILWRHVYWDRHSPDRDIKQQSRWGWLFYRRVKTSKSFYRPMNRVVHAHIKSIMPENPNPDAPVFRGGGTPQCSISCAV